MSTFAPWRRVFRISAPKGAPSDAFPPIPDRHRGTGIAEPSLIPDFDASLAKLRAGIVSTMRAAGFQPKGGEQNTTNFPIYGLSCIKDRTQCLGDNQ